MYENNLVENAILVFVGMLLGLGIAFLASLSKVNRQRSQLHGALYQELAQCHEAIDDHLESQRLHLDVLKMKLKTEIAFVTYDAAAEDVALLYNYPEHSYFVACYGELRKLTELPSQTDRQELLQILTHTMEMIDNPSDATVRATVLKFLRAKRHKDTKPHQDRS